MPVDPTARIKGLDPELPAHHMATARDHLHMPAAKDHITTDHQNMPK